MIDGRQPFGLPDGSVRAILTVAFIVLVGVLSAYMVTGYQNRSPFSSEDIALAIGLEETAATKLADNLRDQLKADGLVITRPTIPAPSPPPGAAGAASGGTEKPKFDIFFRSRIDNRMADDIAKQTLTMISTILAAMIGFYFAARSGSDGIDPVAVRLAEAKGKLSGLIARGGARERLQTIALVLDEQDKRAAQIQDEAQQTKVKEKIKALRERSDRWAGAHAALQAVQENAKASVAETEKAVADYVLLQGQVETLSKDIEKSSLAA